jgi:glycosyltransferase involved in cell wall biosynthesis
LKDTKRASNNNIDKLDTKFSVSMCVYKNDNPEHFKEALESVINQTRQPDEIVLVVDGPIPKSVNEVIINYKSNTFFKVIRLPKNVGHGNSRRIGLENCSYKLIALMDADDICVHDRFEKQLMCFSEDKKLSIVGSNIKEFIDSVGNVIGIREVPQDDSEIKSYMKKRCPLNHMTVMFKHFDVETAGGYLDWYYNEDYYLWIRMYLNGATFKNLNDSLVYVRVGEEMYQRRGGWKYFKSEASLQGYMFNHGIINIVRYIYNVAIRLILQVLLPNRLRGFVFKKFVRKKA